MPVREVVRHPEGTPVIDAVGVAEDLDDDGLPDALEDALARRWAPIVQLAPAPRDWTRPASVDWYLRRVRMRLDRRGQPDVPVLAVGAVSERNIAQQCVRFGAATQPLWRHCSNEDVEFFLQPTDDEVHAGAPDSEWVTYAHVRKSRSVPGGIDLQYWFFWPYNDGFAAGNHEGDWEQTTLVLSRSDMAAELEMVDCSQHRGIRRYRPSAIERRAGRPVVYCADGSHAIYHAPGAFPIPDVPFGISDHTFAGGPAWDTRVRLVNVGERDHPRNGQYFIDYGGRWGEVGEFEFTSGPRGPAFHSSWWE